MNQASAKADSKQHRMIDWLVTLPYIFIFIGILVVFHPICLLATLMSRRLHKHALDLMNICIIWNIRLVAGARYSVIGEPHLPPGRSVVIVSNHQSMYDIPMTMWECREQNVGYIAKKELGRWIPSISLALRKLGSVLIDRKDAAQAVRDIEEFGRKKEQLREVAAIFPEGTRARDGVMKRFKATGLKALLRSMPNAIIQPLAIRGNWELLRYNFFPIPYGTTIELEFLPILERQGLDEQQLVNELEQILRRAACSRNQGEQSST
jgi:1-acyl-sn-glycerol-3-phosphate acyltransferase